MEQDDWVLDRLAREILMVDDHGESLVPNYVSIIEHGLAKPLPPEAERKDVLIVGAGIAGLLAGRILKNAGYNVKILEANDNRVGGRIKTFHTRSESTPAFQDPAQYAEAGAMRIPTTHPLVNKLIQVMGLSSETQTFYNIDVDKDDASKQTYRAWLKTNNLLVRRIKYNRRELPTDQLTMGFPIAQCYSQKTADELLAEALKEPKDLITPDPSASKEEQIQHQIAGWKEVIRRFDAFSMRTYLLDYYTRRGVPAMDQESLIAYIGTLQNLTSRLFLSFIHSFVDTFYISPGTQYMELKGGNWRLPNAFITDLRDNLVMDARAVEIQWSDPHSGLQGSKAIHQGRPGVYVRTINEPMEKRGVVRKGWTRKEQEFTADYLLCAIPFSALRFVEISPEFTFQKRRAIIELHYDSATKVLLEFSERFWEWDEATWRNRLPDEYRGHDAYGGSSVADSPNRFIYFPSHAVPGSSGGVVLSSYTWADDASRWDSIPSEDRYTYALKGLTDIYGEGIKRYFTGFGRTESWMENYYSFGEAAVFAPGQLMALHPYIPQPEGLVYFAGEHTSLKHAWIEGAIESGIRAVLEIHNRRGKKETGSGVMLS